MILPMLDDEPILNEIAERNIRENERMKIILRMQKCVTLDDYKKLLNELVKSVDISL